MYGYINMKTGLKTLIDLLNIIMNVYNWSRIGQKMLAFLL